MVRCARCEPRDAAECDAPGRAPPRERATRLRTGACCEPVLGARDGTRAHAVIERGIGARDELDRRENDARTLGDLVVAERGGEDRLPSVERAEEDRALRCGNAR